MKKYLVLLLVLPCLLACKCNKKLVDNAKQEDQQIILVDINIPAAPMQEEMTISRAGPPTIVYKTKADFSNYVPVIMNANKTEIVSYPAPSDIYYEGKLAKPTNLKNGYLLDNRGINEHVAFLNYTYEEYGKMDHAPRLSEMKNNIKEKYPLVEMIDCGARHQYKNIVEDLNILIDADFQGCRIVLKAPELKIFKSE